MSYAVDPKTIVKASGGIFHNRVTLNDSMLLGGNPPFQPQVSISNGQADSLGVAERAPLCRSAMTAIDPVFKHPTAYMWSVGRAARDSAQLHHGRHVRRTPRRCTSSASATSTRLLAGTDPGESGREHCGASTVQGLRPIRLSENAGYSKYNSLQVSAERRYKNGFKFSVAYTLGHSEDNASNKRDILFNAYDDTGFWGNSSFDRRHVFAFSYIYDLPFYHEQAGVIGKMLGGWQITGSTFMRTGTPLWVTEGADTRRHRRHVRRSPGISTAIRRRNANEKFSAGNGLDQNYWFDKTVYLAAGRRHVRHQRAAEQHLQPGPVPVGHRAVQERQRRGSRRRPVPGGDLQLPEPRELERRRGQSDERARSAASPARTTRAGTSS